MSEADSAAELREYGVVLLRGIFAPELLTRLKEAAERCFEAVETEGVVPERYRFNCFSHSVLLTALLDFGCVETDLAAPLAAQGIEQLFSGAMGSEWGNEWACRMKQAWKQSLAQSWVRKKFAPLLAPVREYHPQGWHQDGALGVQFPAEPGAGMPMTELLTCWIPLNPCGRDSPGLEFVRARQDALLHFTELEDVAVRRRFEVEAFWAPELEFGDGLVFLNSVLHRTYARPEMRRNRLSVEYRIFPPQAA